MAKKVTQSPASAPTPPAPQEVAAVVNAPAVAPVAPVAPVGPSPLVTAMRKMLKATPTDLATLPNWSPDNYTTYLTLRAEVEALLSKEK